MDVSHRRWHELTPFWAAAAVHNRRTNLHSPGVSYTPAEWARLEALATALGHEAYRDFFILTLWLIPSAVVVVIALVGTPVLVAIIADTDMMTMPMLLGSFAAALVLLMIVALPAILFGGARFVARRRGLDLPAMTSGYQDLVHRVRGQFFRSMLLVGAIVLIGLSIGAYFTA